MRTLRDCSVKACPIFLAAEYRRSLAKLASIGKKNWNEERSWVSWKFQLRSFPRGSLAHIPGTRQAHVSLGRVSVIPRFMFVFRSRNRGANLVTTDYTRAMSFTSGQQPTPPQQKQTRSQQEQQNSTTTATARTSPCSYHARQGAGGCDGWIIAGR